MSPKRNMTVDTLHAIYLGVMNAWCRTCLWHVLLSGWFGVLGTAEETLQIAVLCLKHQLMGFYKQHHRGNPNENLTRVADFTLKMVGKESAPKCKTKGAETYGVMLFLLSVLEQHSPHLTQCGRQLIIAGKALSNMLDALANCGLCVLADVQVRWFEFYNQHLDAIRSFATFVPKHHIVVHMLDKMSYQGNPVYYATWLDESLNKTLKAICRFTSQATFEISVLTRIRIILAGFLTSKRGR